MSTSDPTGTQVTTDLSIASAPCDIDGVPRLLNELASLGRSHDLLADRDGRLSLLDKARSLVAALETPRETVIRQCGAETASFYSIALGVDVGLFKELAKDGGSAKKAPTLAEALGFDVDVLRRILRHLTAMKHIKQTGPDEYAPNNFTLSLAHPIMADGYPVYRDFALPSISHLHTWLSTKSYAAPVSVVDNPFTFGHQTSLSAFSYLATHPRIAEQFNHHMGGYRLGRPDWFHTSIYPVQERLLDGYEDTDGEALLVDVGGNMGHDLLSFHAAFEQQLKGRLILQDVPAVIKSAPTDELKAAGIEAMVHDFFTKQPVKGARGYYLHHILHDWQDERCVEIVGRIKEVMKPGYSRLLVNEHVIPAMGVGWEATYLDLYMMTMFGAAERTEEELRVLLEEKCGLRVMKVWNPGNGVEGIIECEVPVVC